MRHRHAFTLAELLVVILVVCLLAALTFPVIVSSKAAGQRTVCAAHLQQLGTAMALYQNDNGDELPIDNPRTNLTYGPRGTKPYVRRDPLVPYGMSLPLYKCAYALQREDDKDDLLSDYIIRFTVDFSELRGSSSLKYRLQPNPTTVLAWDWNHTSGDINKAGTRWTYLRSDGSVSTAASETMNRSFLQLDGSWKVESGLNGTYQFVFPGELWPPGFHSLPD